MLKVLNKRAGLIRTMEEFGKLCLDIEQACAFGEINGFQKNRLLDKAERQMIKLGLMEIWRAN